MKKFLFFALFILFGTTTAVYAQENTGQTREGNWLVEVNTNFGTTKEASTGISFASSDGSTQYNFGGEVGYFVIENLALKLGLGYNGTSYSSGGSSNAFAYKVGAKYYIQGNIPIQLDFSGASIKNVDENPSFLGLQVGYALFLGQHLSLEPGVRYNFSLNNDYTDQGIFELNIGFAAFF